MYHAGLAPDAIAGIVIGIGIVLAIVVIAIICVGLYKAWKQRRSKKGGAPADHGNQGGSV